FLTILIFLFYFQRFGRACAAAAVFFSVNLAGSVVLSIMGNQDLYGASYLAAGVAASVVGIGFLLPTARRFDNYLYYQASRT
ncbi:MAG TPA: hypothetical protein ENN69_09165, partial [Spirochaetia bacterium]|nr:hypothetical protein [Spirochaetia bacterium]